MSALILSDIHSNLEALTAVSGRLEVLQGRLASRRGVQDEVEELRGGTQQRMDVADAVEHQANGEAPAAMDDVAEISGDVDRDDVGEVQGDTGENGSAVQVDGNSWDVSK